MAKQEIQYIIWHDRFLSIGLDIVLGIASVPPLLCAGASSGVSCEQPMGGQRASAEVVEIVGMRVIFE